VKTAEDLKLPVPALAARDGDGLRQPNMLAVELGTIANLGGHELRAKLMPARDLDQTTVEVRIEGVHRATTQINRRSLLSVDIRTIRQLENKVSSLPRLAAEVDARRQEALSRVEQADKALSEPFKRADALKAAQTNSARIDQLMADARNPAEQAQHESTKEVAPARNATTPETSFPQQPSTSVATATDAQQRIPNSAANNKPNTGAEPQPGEVRPCTTQPLCRASLLTKMLAAAKCGRYLALAWLERSARSK
jgi:hypothetical protein